MQQETRFPKTREIVEYLAPEGHGKLFVVEGSKRRFYSRNPREVSFGVVLTLRELGPDAMYNADGAVLEAKLTNDQARLLNVVGVIAETEIPANPL